MLKVKKMPLEQFLITASKTDKVLLNKMREYICDTRKTERPYLHCSAMPFYTSSDGRILGSGECNDILSHRKGYGFTIIRVGDMGTWYCPLHSDWAKDNDIVFYDGGYDEVYKRLIRFYER